MQFVNNIPSESILVRDQTIVNCEAACGADADDMTAVLISIAMVYYSFRNYPPNSSYLWVSLPTWHLSLASSTSPILPTTFSESSNSSHSVRMMASARVLHCPSQGTL